MAGYENIAELSKINEVTLNISDIHCGCYVWAVPKSNFLLGIINFSGKYRYGSGGSDDALFIDWRINEFCDLEFPDKISAMIVDFSSLDYEWGDDLEIQPGRLRQVRLPVRIVVREECYEAFQGVLGDEELKTNLLDALNEIKGILQKQ